ncbi:unnamed protein product [Ceratitis capitata]|uniref:(Mediterranean fruit fly) hypothetical protein n=1 Tax=Ceratitis capitata TaxID=7213 RepID=A0A811UMT7_CERCA|nr:unnamed protein product [Ceratitis capitata]
MRIYAKANATLLQQQQMPNKNNNPPKRLAKSNLYRIKMPECSYKKPTNRPADEPPNRQRNYECMSAMSTHAHICTQMCRPTRGVHEMDSQKKQQKF